MQCSRRILSIEPSSSKSGTPTSMAGESASSAWSAVASIETIGGDFLRRRMSTMLNVSLCNHVENAESPRNVFSLRNTCINASWVKSSASIESRTIRRQRAYTRPALESINLLEGGGVAQLRLPDGFAKRCLIETVGL